MAIQWFPGHMAKTLKDIEANLKLCSIIIYVLDARAPLSTLNPKIDKIVKDRQIIYVINKTDLACEAKTTKFAQNLRKDGKTVVVASMKSSETKLAILAQIKALYQEKAKRLEGRGITKVLRAMVIGVPNTGKSTLINTLAKTKKAQTGDKAGVTRQTSWVKVDDMIELLDTPGTLWPAFENNDIAVKLAMIGSIKDDVLDMAEMGLECVKMIRQIAPQNIIDRYNLDYTAETIKEAEPIEILDQICLKRGFVLKKNEIDYERAGKAILGDFRSAKLGKITLD
ncbi:MAG: ribosome biogenesis GTPase YlqF [Clostridia bacterium]|nr:ribosome biogenesis GTPase YlqF [Clostridia bacterium]